MVDDVAPDGADEPTLRRHLARIASIASITTLAHVAGVVRELQDAGQCAAAISCPAGARMVRPPDERCPIW